jgi:hypothetical protein
MQAVAVGGRYGPGTGCGPDFPENVPEMELHRVVADVELPRDGPVALAGGQQLQHLELPLAELPTAGPPAGGPADREGARQRRRHPSQASRPSKCGRRGPLPGGPAARCSVPPRTTVNAFLVPAVNFCAAKAGKPARPAREAGRFSSGGGSGSVLSELRPCARSRCRELPQRWPRNLAPRLMTSTSSGRWFRAGGKRPAAPRRQSP